jgi:hypothetical protein
MKTFFSIRLSAARFTLAGVVTALLVLIPGMASAQSGIGDIVYTVGTVAHDSHGRDWAYLLWQGTQPGLISNRVFAVYSKPGDPTNNVPYTRLSLVSVQTDARVIEPLLERAANLGDDLNKLQSDLLQLFGSFMPASAISRADQLSAVVRGSLNDPRYYQNLLLLARNHAGINLALGYADAELIGPGRTTFEIRAFDPVLSQDLAVIGRTTVEAGNPTVLPPPGPPVLVPEPSAMGDLNIKFRWGTPDNLRRLGLMQFGYNLYRIANGYATAHGWNVGNPPPLQVLSDLVNTNPAVAKRVNRVPITPSKLFSLPEAADIVPPTGDTNTFFIMDDDGRGRTNYINYGFTNGAQFLYFTAARDVLGRDGVLSPGLVATVCDRMPPYPPTHIHVLNDYQYNISTMTSNQALRVVWRQSQQTNDHVVNYWVYRWTNLVQMNALQGNPANNLIAVVPHTPGVTNNSYLDDGSGSPSALGAYGETFWYTVRAGDAGACGANLSGAGGPAYGVLRDRIGPPAGTGRIEINCLRPVVNFAGENLPPLKPPDSTNFDLFLKCTRLDNRFEWAEFYGIATYSEGVSGPPITTTVSNYFGRLYYLGAPAVSAWWYPPRNPFTNGQVISLTMQVYCRAALLNGKISNFAIATVNPPSVDVYADVEFRAIAETIRVTAGDRKNSDCHEHDPGGGSNIGGTNGIGIIFNPTVGSAEYRLYRRVDAGPLSLLCQGPITNILQVLECFENAPPVNGGSICFYLQLLDVNGNPSPLTPLGCVDTAPNTPLPTPVLAKITSDGDQSSPGMKLSWFSPPYGVDRFEVRIAGLPTPPNTNQYALSQQLSSTGAPPATVTFVISGTNLTLPFNSFRTPKVGPGFGNNGAVFQIPCNVELGKNYFVTVRALSKNGDAGEFSNYEGFIWAVTNVVSPQVPWPARPLPPTAANFFALGFFLSPTSPNPALRTGTFTGNGVLVGFSPFSLRTIISTKDGPLRVAAQFDPGTILETNGFGGPIFPCAMYRYQVPNANFPTTSGDTIQVSPLMENIAYQLSGTPGQTTNTVILDPFVAGTVSADNANNYLWLWLADTQPIVSGATYKYILVHFGPNHEIDQLIPSNDVNVP